MNNVQSLQKTIAAIQQSIETCLKVGTPAEAIETLKTTLNSLVLKLNEEVLKNEEPKQSSTKPTQDEQSEMIRKGIEAASEYAAKHEVFRNDIKNQHLNEALKLYSKISGRVITRQDIAEILAHAKEIALNDDSYCFKGIEDRETSKIDWLNSLKAISPIVDKNSIVPYIKTMVELNDYIYYNNRHQSNLFVFSNAEGNGKSTLINTIVNAYGNQKVKSDTSEWPRGEYTDTSSFAKNLIVKIDDTSMDSLRNINQDQLKAILRRESDPSLVCNIKYQPSVMLKARAVVLAAGNVKPPLSSDRTWRIIKTNDTTIETMLQDKYSRNLLKKAEQDSGAVGMKLPKIAITTMLTKLSSMKQSSYGCEDIRDLPLVNEFYEMCQNTNLPLECITLVKLMRDQGYSKEEIAKLAPIFNKTLLRLLEKRYVVRLTKGDTLYQKWNFTAFREIPKEAFEYDVDSDPMQAAEEEWDRIIAELCGNPVPPAPKKEEEEPTAEAKETSAATELSIEALFDALENGTSFEQIAAAPKEEPIAEEAPAEKELSDAEDIEAVLAKVDPAKLSEYDGCVATAETYLEMMEGFDEDRRKQEEAERRRQEMLESRAKKIPAKEEVPASEQVVPVFSFDEPRILDFITEPLHSYKDQFTKTPTDNPTDQFETLNATLDGRSNEDCYDRRNFIFEMDNEPLESQKVYVKRLSSGKVINRFVYSGGKSIHMRITANRNIRNDEEYKFIWNKLNDLYFDGKADKACANPARLTRKLDGIRESNGKKQCGKVITDNGKPILIDVSEFIEEYKKYQLDKQALKELRSYFCFKKPQTKETLETTVSDWKQSKSKEAILSCIAGDGTYEQGIAAMATAAWLGFSYEQVVKEIKPGKWNFTRKFYEQLQDKAA